MDRAFMITPSLQKTSRVELHPFKTGSAGWRWSAEAYRGQRHVGTGSSGRFVLRCVGLLLVDIVAKGVLHWG